VKTLTQKEKRRGREGDPDAPFFLPSSFLARKQVERGKGGKKICGKKGKEKEKEER